MKVIDMLTSVMANGVWEVVSTSGNVENKLVITSTRTDDRANRNGAPAAVAKKMNITYIKVFEAALFSTNSFYWKKPREI